MGRVNAFVEAGNDTGRTVSVGGSRQTNRAWARLNTDTADGEAGMHISAEVIGQGLTSQERRRKDGDQRQAVFTVELPPASGSVSVRILPSGGRMEELVRIGAVLCGMKAALHAADGDIDRAVSILGHVGEVLGQIEQATDDRLSNVTLPGGVTLRHALACVELVRRLREGDDASAS
jgi:hypothetical protein